LNGGQAGIVLESEARYRPQERAMKKEPLFYLAREESHIAGPYDLVQMAGLLRRKIISPETMSRLEGEDDWKPFSWQPQYSVVREMPPDAASSRVDDLEAKADAEAKGPIPLPSRESLVKLGVAMLGALLLGGGSFLLAWLDQTLGICVLVVGVAAVVIAQCFIFGQMLEEDVWTWMGLIFVPSYNLFYLICNLPIYTRWLCVKYLGVAVAVGAAWGLAHHS
jgi:hypothetical protein